MDSARFELAASSYFEAISSINRSLRKFLFPRLFWINFFFQSFSLRKFLFPRLFFWKKRLLQTRRSTNWAKSPLQNTIALSCWVLPHLRVCEKVHIHLASGGFRFCKCGQMFVVGENFCYALLMAAERTFVVKKPFWKKTTKNNPS